MATYFLPLATVASIIYIGSGCKEIALISGPTHRVADNQLSASTSYPGWDHGPRRSRLNTPNIPSRGQSGAWCASVNSPHQWIQVDFLKRMHVTSIATQARNAVRQWVTSYQLFYSNDGHSFTAYKEGGVIKTFRGNWEYEIEILNKHQLLHPFDARIVRLVAKTWYNLICLRWEVYGCPLLDENCPYGFAYSYSHGTPTGVPTKPYQASCYKFATDQASWLDARKTCLVSGGDLVSVETAGEQHHLETVIRGHPNLQKPALTKFRGWGYWTSGTDLHREGDWIWAATGRKLGYLNWMKGQPDNNNNSGRLLPENCMVLYPSHSYKWNDFVCNSQFISFICETKAV